MSNEESKGKQHNQEEHKEAKDSTMSTKNRKIEKEPVVNDAEYNNGKWTDEEHEKFLSGLLKFGKNWN